MFKKKNFFTLILLASLLFLLYGSYASAMPCASWLPSGICAQDPTAVSGSGGTGFEIGTDVFEPNDPGEPLGWFEGIVANAIGYIFLIGMILAPLLILIGAFMFFTAAGDPSRAQGAKRLIIGASVGLAILLFGRVILAILKFILDF